MKLIDFNKKAKPWEFIVIVVLLIASIFFYVANADEYHDSGTGEGGGSGHGMTIDGPSYQKTGWIMYLIKTPMPKTGETTYSYADAERVCEPFIYFCGNGATLKPSNVEIHPRFGSSVSFGALKSGRNLSKTFPMDPPITKSGDSNGVSIMNWMREWNNKYDMPTWAYMFQTFGYIVAPGDSGIQEFLTQWNNSKFTDQYYYVVEPIFYSTFYKNNTRTSTKLFDTAYGWALEAQKQGVAGANGWLGGSRTQIGRYTNSTFMNAARLDANVLGMTSSVTEAGNPHGYHTFNDILRPDCGNGFWLFWITQPQGPLPPVVTTDPPSKPGDLGGQDPRDDSTEDELGNTPKKLYEIENWSDEFEISKLIPSGENVNNAFQADSFYGSAILAEANSPSVTYTKKVTYKWTTTSSYTKADGTKGHHTEHHKEEKERTFKASVRYQYVKHMHLFALDNVSVINKAFPQEVIYNKDNAEVFPEIVADTMLYGGDQSYGTNPFQLNVSGEKHYYLPPSSFVSSETVKGRPSDSDFNSRVRKEMNRVNDASWSRNDRIIINETVNGVTKSYPFMQDTQIQGAIITGGSGSGYYHSAGLSSSGTMYGQAGVELASVLPQKAKGKQTLLIPENTDNNDYPTGVKVQYTNLVSTDTARNPYFLAGRYIYGTDVNTVSMIYDHVSDKLATPTLHPFASTQFVKGDAPDLDGYPVKVHTPVITPISLTDGNGVSQTEADEQLLDVDDDAQYQAKLDKQYLLRFDTALWESAIWGTDYKDLVNNPSNERRVRYDKYVLKKEVKFPFDVYYDGTFYEAGTWIEVAEPSSYTDDWDVGQTTEPKDFKSGNHWINMPIYIPSYAKEGTGDIYARVYAYNVGGRFESGHYSEIEHITDPYHGSQSPGQPYDPDKNPGNSQKSTTPVEGIFTDESGNQYTAYTYESKSKYVAEARITCQLSGHIYGFTIVGVSDTDEYYFCDPHQRVTDRMNFSLANVKEEKKAGVFNRFNNVLRNRETGLIVADRFGEDSIRYQKDGSLTRGVPPENMLPLRKGSNKSAGTHMGDGRLVMGSLFYYNLKTIANLWGDNDYIEITPSLKIYTKDGKLINNDEVVFMYETPQDSYCYYGSKNDTARYTVCMGSRAFRESYYTDKDTYKVSEDNDDMYYRYGDWMNYTIARWQAAHPRDEFPRHINDYMLKCHPCFTHTNIRLDRNLRLLTGEWEELSKNRHNQNNEIIEYFDWDDDGNYEGGLDSHLDTMFRDSMQTWYGGYGLPGSFTLYDGTRKDIEYNGGFAPGWDFRYDMEDIVVNFDIVAYKDGKPHLAYGGMANGGRVWDKEGYGPERYDDPANPDKTLYTPDGSPFDPGDVVVYDPNRLWGDKFTIELLDIN